MGFPHPLQLPQPRLRDQVLQPNPDLCVRRSRNFPVVSRALHQLCRAILRKLHGVAKAFSLYHSSQQMKKLFAVQRSLSGYRFLLDMLSHRE